MKGVNQEITIGTIFADNRMRSWPEASVTAFPVQREKLHDQVAFLLRRRQVARGHALSASPDCRGRKDTMTGYVSIRFLPGRCAELGSNGRFHCRLSADQGDYA
jgi:hypothetical protein